MSYEHHYYKPVVPPWVAEILAFEKQTGNIHHPDKARGQKRKDWREWKRKYSRKLKYARLNGWVVETEAMRSNRFVYSFAIYDWQGRCHWYHHRAENELSPKTISRIEEIILKANPRAASCHYRPPGKRSDITLEVSYEIVGDVTAEELATATSRALNHIRNEVGFDFADEDSFVEGIIVTPKQA